MNNNAAHTSAIHEIIRDSIDPSDLTPEQLMALLQVIEVNTLKLPWTTKKAIKVIKL